jgi:hypothetical protein
VGTILETERLVLREFARTMQMIWRWSFAIPSA